jgi:hypothetical protein
LFPAAGADEPLPLRLRLPEFTQREAHPHPLSQAYFTFSCSGVKAKNQGSRIKPTVIAGESDPPRSSNTVLLLCSQKKKFKGYQS